MSRVTSSGRELETRIGPTVRMDEAPDVARARVLVVDGLIRRLLGPASTTAAASTMVPYEAMAAVERAQRPKGQAKV